MVLLSNNPETVTLPLILPGSLEYQIAQEELGLFPGAMQAIHQASGEVAFVSRPGSGGLLEAVSLAEFAEYMNDGEFELRQAELEEQWEMEDEMWDDEWL